MGWYRLGAILLLSVLAGCDGLLQSESKPAPPAAAKVDTAPLLAAADATRGDGRFAEATAIYEQILVADPNSAEAQYGVAECLLGVGRAADAKPIFQGLQSKENFHGLALQGVGIADLALDKREDAGAALKEAVAADPK
jgi:tetratricopeptide (TPR) repeat protein